MRFRFALPQDAGLLAPMNLQLIRDEGHRNVMSLAQLRERMLHWLSGEYQAALFEDGTEAVGYALFRREAEYVYLRQFFVLPARRRQGVATQAMAWLWKNAWADAPRLRIDVLVGNAAGRAFWQKLGFADYCITMECSPPRDD